MMPVPVKGSGLRERYQLFKAVGSDEAADFFIARDLADDAPVRLRVIRPGAFPDDRARNDAIRSLALALEWRHSNAVLLREVGIDEGRLYVVTERPRGAPLRERILAGPEALDPTFLGSLPIAAEIVRDVLKVLEGAVVAGIPHPGISLDNIFVNPFGEIEVADFGLPVLPIVDALARKEVATAAYLRPLDARPGMPATVAQQLYSAASLLLWLVSGQPPFPGSSLEQVQRRHRSRMAPSLMNIVPTAPPELAATIALCLRKDPAGRPTTFAPLRDALSLLDPVSAAERRAVGLTRIDLTDVESARDRRNPLRRLFSYLPGRGQQPVKETA